jgi:hypothetical protein
MSEATSKAFEQRRAEQRRAWARLSYRERLAWLEQAKQFAAKALAAARARKGESKR